MNLLTIHQKRAFTLSELLIVLAVLGLVATFTLPKLLQNTQQTGNSALLKSTIFSLEAAFRQAADAGTLNQTQTVYQVLSSTVNAAKLCAVSLTDGCWTTTSLGTGYAQSGMILQSGAVVSGLSTSTIAGTTEDIALDTNGGTGPNTTGSDQIRLDVCVSSSGCTNSSGYSANYGDVMPYSSDKTYFNTIMGL